MPTVVSLPGTADPAIRVRPARLSGLAPLRRAPLVELFL
jgi:hypothetical protein